MWQQREGERGKTTILSKHVTLRVFHREKAISVCGQGLGTILWGGGGGGGRGGPVLFFLKGEKDVVMTALRFCTLYCINFICGWL